MVVGAAGHLRRRIESDAIEEEEGMQIDRDGEAIKITLTPQELHLLKRAIERASFVDTPVSEQPEILAFCSRVLEAIGPAA